MNNDDDLSIKDLKSKLVFCPHFRLTNPADQVFIMTTTTENIVDKDFLSR